MTMTGMTKHPITGGVMGCLSGVTASHLCNGVCVKYAARVCYRVLNCRTEH